MRWQDELCSGCKHPLADTTDIDGPAYDATPVRCAACQAREDAAKAFASQKGASTHGLYFTVTEQEAHG